MDNGTLGLANCVREFAGKTAFVDDERALTYGQFGERVRRVARVLAAQGVGPGDRVAIMLANSIEFFEVWAAAAELHASVVLVNWHLKRDELAYILTDSQAKLLVADPSL